jgi:hypothetical protein
MLIIQQMVSSYQYICEYVSKFHFYVKVDWKRQHFCTFFIEEKNYIMSVRIRVLRDAFTLVSSFFHLWKYPPPALTCSRRRWPQSNIITQLWR